MLSVCPAYVALFSTATQEKIVIRPTSPSGAPHDDLTSSAISSVIPHSSARLPTPAHAAAQTEWHNHSVTYSVEPDAAMNRLIEQYSARPITSFTLRQLYQYGVNHSERNLLASARFLHSELAIRFAQRIQFVRDLPYRLGESPLMRAVQRHYTGSFALLHRFPCPETFADAEEFTRLVQFFFARSASVNAGSLSLIMCRAAERRMHAAAAAAAAAAPNGSAGGHGGALPFALLPAASSTSAPGIGLGGPAAAAAASTAAASPAAAAAAAALASASSAPVYASAPAAMPPSLDNLILQECLDQFHASRLETRVLLAHHLALFAPRDGFVGLIEVRCRPVEVVRAAAAAAAAWARVRLALPADDAGALPEVHVVGSLDTALRHSRAHMLFVVQELLQQAFEATVRTHGHRRARGESLPPVKVVVSETEREVVIKISDEGGGLHREDMEAVWSYRHEYLRLKEEHAAATAAAAASKAAAGERAGAHGAATSATAPLQACDDDGAAGDTGDCPAALATADSATANDHLAAAALASAAAAVGAPTAGVSAASNWTGGADSRGNTLLGHPETLLSPALVRLCWPSAWCGFGMPIARMIARYLDGDLRLASMHGYGTDAYLYVNKIETAGASVEPSAETFNYTPAEHAYV
jgi:hypothetical protein